MERKYGSAEEALDVAKEALWLAWNACGGTSGYGFIRDNPKADKQAIWDNAVNMGDYSGRIGLQPSDVDADYVFGRMLKLYFNLDGNSIRHDDSEPRLDYQAWCGKYKSYAALFDAAEEITKKMTA